MIRWPQELLQHIMETTQPVWNECEERNVSHFDDSSLFILSTFTEFEQLLT